MGATRARRASAANTEELGQALEQVPRPTRRAPGPRPTATTRRRMEATTRRATAPRAPSHPRVAVPASAVVLSSPPDSSRPRILPASAVRRGTGVVLDHYGGALIT